MCGDITYNVNQTNTQNLHSIHPANSEMMSNSRSTIMPNKHDFYILISTPILLYLCLQRLQHRHPYTHFIVPLNRCTAAIAG
jgi:hypothetical protein